MAAKELLRLRWLKLSVDQLAGVGTLVVRVRKHGSSPGWYWEMMDTANPEVCRLVSCGLANSETEAKHECARNIIERQFSD